MSRSVIAKMRARPLLDAYRRRRRDTSSQELGLMLSFGFPPVSSPSSKVLILGSLPGRLSLERAEYYASPRNAFWQIVACHLSMRPSVYADRANSLIGRDIALWDVLAAATRSGSLDASIADDAVANNFRAFFHVHTQIGLIFFNGATAARLYRQHVVPTLSQGQRLIEQHTLPSTSPAHASMSVADKAERWSIVFSQVAAARMPPRAPPLDQPRLQGASPK